MTYNSNNKLLFKVLYLTYNTFNLHVCNPTYIIIDDLLKSIFSNMDYFPYLSDSYDQRHNSKYVTLI